MRNYDMEKLRRDVGIALCRGDNRLEDGIRNADIFETFIREIARDVVLNLKDCMRDSHILCDKCRRAVATSPESNEGGYKWDELLQALQQAKQLEEYAQAAYEAANTAYFDARKRYERMRNKYQAELLRRAVGNTPGAQ